MRGETSLIEAIGRGLFSKTQEAWIARAIEASSTAADHDAEHGLARRWMQACGHCR